MFLASLSIIHQGLTPLKTGQVSRRQPWVLNCIRNHWSLLGADSAPLGITLRQQALQADLSPSERRGSMASAAGRVWKSSPPTRQGYCRITHNTPPVLHEGLQPALPRAPQSLCWESLALLHPLLATCRQHRPLPVLLGQKQLWIFIAATILASLSVTVVHLLKARVQITANLAFNMADDCFLVLFNKLHFFHTKMNRGKTLPVLWGGDLVVGRQDINTVTRVVWRRA